MATAIMKQKGIPEMDDVEEIISKISEESPYKRRPTQKRTWMTVPEMGKLLGFVKAVVKDGVKEDAATKVRRLIHNDLKREKSPV